VVVMMITIVTMVVIVVVVMMLVDRRRVGAAFGIERHLDQRLRLDDDFDEIAVIELEKIAGAQCHRFSEIEGEARPFHAGHAAARRRRCSGVRINVSVVALWFASLVATIFTTRAIARI
jgi:hypothetical protein